MIIFSLRACLRISTHAFFLCSTGVALAQTATVINIDSVTPLSTSCQLPSMTNNTQCTTQRIGTQTVTTLTPFTSTPLPGGGTRTTGVNNIQFDGQLQVDGIRLQADPLAASFFAFDIFNGAKVELATDITNSIDVTNFGGYSIPNSGYSIAVNSANVRSIAIDIQDGLYSDLETDTEGSYTLRSINPTVINNNTTALSGTFSSHGESGDAIVFGTLEGTAKLNSGSLVTTLGDPDFNRSYLSPFQLEIDVTPTVTTQLDESGLITPAITVTGGIAMNGSRITQLGAGIDAGDAVNKAQLDAAIATVSFTGTSPNSVQIGTGSTAVEGKAVSIGFGNIASGDGAVAIGDPNVATGLGAVAIGADNTATGRGTVAMGNRSTALGQSSIALGDTANAASAGNVAIGQSAQASAVTTTAVGNLARATDEDAVAVGDRANASGFHSTAVGGEAVASGRGAQAFGWQSSATGNLSLAAGHQAQATGVQSTAVGKNAIARNDNATAIGFAATTTRANQVAVGGAGSSVTIGDIAASTVAQSGTTDIMTVDASGTIGRDTTIRPAITSLQTTVAQQATALGAIQAINANVNGRVDTLFDLVDFNRKEARRGIAAAVAMTAAPFPSAPGRTSYTANTAVYRGEVAFSASFAHRLDTEKPFAITAGISHSGGKDTAGRVGVAGEF